MLARLNDGFITSCRFIVMLPLGQMKITAASTTQNEKVNHKMFLRVETFFKMVEKVNHFHVSARVKHSLKRLEK